MPKIRVLIVDDHAILREGIRALLVQSGEIDVVGEAADGREAIERTAALDPDVVLLDVAMPGLGGLEAALQIRRDSPRSKILVLTQYDDAAYVRRALKAGASGYVLKKAAGAELVQAIRNVHRGGLVLDPAIARGALEIAAPSPADEGEDSYDTLTDREKQVLCLVAEGKSNKEVAELLGISVKTAMSHREHILSKLGLHGRTDLVKFALARGVIRLD